MRLRVPILVKLLVVLVIPAVLLFTLFGRVAYQISRNDLDDELGRRLEAIAVSAAPQIRDGKYMHDLAPGQEDESLYQAYDKRLAMLAEATGARLFVVDDKYDLKLDSAHAPIGTHEFHAEIDRDEIARVWEHGQPTSSVTFQGNDGTWYKTGYAAVRVSPTDSTTVLVLGVQAPASYFERLDDLKTRLFEWGVGLAVVSIAAALIATLLITRNIRKLAAAAERIGGGDLRAPVRINTRDELGVLGDAMDRMRGQLAERDARMQQMLAGIAHEVRNPLAGMTLFAGILSDELPVEDERRGHVEKIKRELGYLERVVNEFLEYARRPKPEIADVNVGELLDEVAQLASTQDLQVRIGWPGETLVTTKMVARADRGQVRRALLNLARNAVQAATAAGHAGEQVRLSAKKLGDEVHLSVWNRGVEISPETSAKLFQPFFTTREKGTGLGLAFVREIAVDHGGRVEVKSEGGETTFTVVLPAR